MAAFDSIRDSLSECCVTQLTSCLFSSTSSSFDASTRSTRLLSSCHTFCSANTGSIMVSWTKRASSSGTSVERGGSGDLARVRLAVQSIVVSKAVQVAPREGRLTWPEFSLRIRRFVERSTRWRRLRCCQLQCGFGRTRRRERIRRSRLHSRWLSAGVE